MSIATCLRNGYDNYKDVQRVKMVAMSTESHLHHMRGVIAELNDFVLSHVALLSEIPTPTYGERTKAIFLSERLSKSQLDDCAIDDAGNALGILHGKKEERTILLVAHLDTNFKAEVDHTVSFDHDHIHGVGVADNSLGAAVVASLPHILQRLELQFDATIIFMGSVHSLGSGNIAGIRSFLNNTRRKIDNAICIEGNALGRLSVSSQSMFRGEIHYSTPEQIGRIYNDAQNAVMCLNLIINHMLELRLPRKPLTSIIINAVRCGRSFNAIPTEGTVRFEIHSESEGLVKELTDVVQNICDEASARGEASIMLKTVATRRTGGLPFSHPMVGRAREILRTLDVEPYFQYSTSELSACIDHGIPAVTLGITTGTQINTTDEQVDIAPISTGIMQLIELLSAIDRGECDSDGSE